MARKGYREKRDFEQTSEPLPRLSPRESARSPGRFLSCRSTMPAGCITISAWRLKVC
jgi:hypothetical protein